MHDNDEDVQCSCAKNRKLRKHLKKNKIKLVFSSFSSRAKERKAPKQSIKRWDKHKNIHSKWNDEAKEIAPQQLNKSVSDFVFALKCSWNGKEICCGSELMPRIEIENEEIRFFHSSRFMLKKQQNRTNNEANSPRYKAFALVNRRKI